jgi:hypothetical protein
VLQDCPNLRNDNWFKPGDAYFPLPSETAGPVDDNLVPLLVKENFQAAAIECYVCTSIYDQDPGGIKTRHFKAKSSSN